MKVQKIILGFLIGISSLSTPIIANGIDTSKILQKACYAQRRIPLDYKMVFETMKDTFVKSNIDLVNLSKEDGFIYGKGAWTQDENIYAISITANFKKIGDITQVILRASYSLSKKKYDTSTGGIAGINFPMPVLWKKQFQLQESGNIIDPNFYMGFFKNFDRVLFDNLMLKTDNKSVVEDKKDLNEEVK